MRFANRGAWLLALLGVVACAPLAHARQGAAAHQAKDAKPDIKPFVGTWKGSFNGKVFAILTLKDERGDLSGTLNNFDIGRDKDGNLDDDTHTDAGDGPILNIHIRSGVLYFFAIQKDQYNPATEWKFVPKSDKEGELTELIDGVPRAANGSIPKPIVMLRERPKP